MKKYILIILAIVFFYKSTLGQPPPCCTSPIVFNYIRALNEINVQNVGDAYPYISPDGLRIYYTSGNDGNFVLYSASRKDLNSLFTNKSIVSNQFPVPTYGCWLTNDQLEIYFSNGKNIFYASRASVSSAFSSYNPVIFNIILKGNTYGLSLTPDKNELYVYNTNVIPSILRFVKAGDYNYNFKDTVTKGFDYDPAYKWFHYYPAQGQLSKDGLCYIGTFDIYNSDFTADTLKICLLQRASLQDTFNFNHFKVLSGKINQFRRNMMPSISADYSTIFLCRVGDSFQWKDNDLYMSMDSTLISEIYKPLLKSNNTQVLVYPNPCSDYIIFKFNKELQNTTIKIYNSMGEEVRRFANIKEEQFKIYRTGLATGLYYFNLRDNNFSTSGKIILE